MTSKAGPQLQRQCAGADLGFEETGGGGAGYAKGIASYAPWRRAGGGGYTPPLYWKVLPDWSLNRSLFLKGNVKLYGIYLSNVAYF